ncbi:MAG: 4-alpha-glucanotransferase, partial [Planctomycetes bacterium]|nr:4-alpha-glucanotransferase [Planctomycetota bacterium]
LAREIDSASCLQYLFFRQWFSLKKYCNERGIQIIGDLPIYIDYDSADVWAHPELFKLDPEKRPYVVAGVPPDYFSETGQRWGNPIYNWDVHGREDFRWWVSRVKHNLARCDRLRIDHFRGLVAYWEIAAQEPTAINGRWIEAPVYALFDRLDRAIPGLPLIAEDLGLITPDVREVRDRLGLPGMKVLLFAFGWDMGSNPYIPHNMERNSVAYTGTHDNNTVRGWFENELSREDLDRLFSYLGGPVSAEEIHWSMVRLAMMSRADTSIIPLQDLMGLGQDARMNKPTTDKGNWRWRYPAEKLTPELGNRLRKMTEIYGRA